LDGPILIGGSSSSGTTLLASVLSRHPDVACGEELSCFDKESVYEMPWPECRHLLTGNPCRRVEIPDLRWRRRLFDGLEDYGISTGEVRALAREADGLAPFFSSFGGRYLERTRKSRWAEKTPSNVYCVGQFLDLFPGGRAVVMMRDGRDCVLSLMRRGRSLYFSTWIWLCAAAAAKRAEGRERCLVVKYEDLAADPEGALKRICGFVDVQYAADLLVPQEKDRRTVHESWSVSPAEAISTGAVGRYLEDLDRETEQVLFSFSLTDTARARYGVSFRTFTEALQAWGYETGERTYPDEPLDYVLRLPRFPVLKRLRRWLKGKQTPDHVPQDLVTSPFLGE